MNQGNPWKSVLQRWRPEDEGALDVHGLRVTEARLQKFVYSSRYILVAMILCLVADLVVFGRLQINTMVGELKHFNEIKPELAIMNILEQADYIMIGVFLIILILGVYSTSISQFKFVPGAPRPAWLDHINVGNLKTKMALSLASISVVGLIPLFQDPNAFTTRQIVVKCAVHVIILGSSVAIHFITKDDGNHEAHHKEQIPNETHHSSIDHSSSTNGHGHGHELLQLPE